MFPFFSEKSQPKQEAQQEKHAEGSFSQPQTSQAHATSVSATGKDNKRRKIPANITKEKLALITVKDAPDPNFEALPPEQVSKLSKKKRKEYNKNLAHFAFDYKLWSDYNANRKKPSLDTFDFNQRDWNFPSVAAKPDAMDEELINNEKDSMRFRKCSAQRYLDWANEDLPDRLKRNAIARMRAITLIKNPDNWAGNIQFDNDPRMKDSPTALSELRKFGLPRDIVARRGTNGHGELAKMLGLENANSSDKLRTALQKKIDEKSDVILTQEGFMPTSLLKDQGFAAGSNDSPGIEFIILAKKGTGAIDYRQGECEESSQALLLIPKTKYRLVKAYFGDRKATFGAPGSWKIYLETIPQNDESGELRQGGK